MIFGGFTLLVLFLKPPHTPCDTQKKLFTKKYSRLLSNSLSQENTQSKGSPEPMSLLYDQCRISNTIGGCVEFLRVLDRIVKDIQKNDTACVKKILSNAKLYQALKSYTEMLVVAAWRENQDKANSWGDMDWIDLYLYCRLKETLTEARGLQDWKKFRKSTLQLIKELHDQEQKRPPQRNSTEISSLYKTLYNETLFRISCKKL